ncbi:hypothetical protein CMO91_01375 [Candidatus Woesearchaeota archaeon]|nr:hypothetical protein [Candidatus Woesearchaeota archaeon]|tara:strand:- start:255 stop:785 length:531 start_codon:yes stop_codon:yes gene_type:complete
MIPKRAGYKDGETRHVTSNCDGCDHWKSVGKLICTYGPEWRQLMYGRKEAEPCTLLEKEAQQSCTVFVEAILRVKEQRVPTKRITMYARQKRERAFMDPDEPIGPVELRASVRQEGFPHDFEVTRPDRVQDYLKAGFTLDWTDEWMILGDYTPGYVLCDMPVDLIQEAGLGDLFGL